MKDLLLGVHVVVKTLNLGIWRCRLADYVKECYYSACRTCSMIIFPHLSNQIIVSWRCRCCCCRRCLNSLVTGNDSAKKSTIWLVEPVKIIVRHVQHGLNFRNREFKQRRRRRSENVIWKWKFAFLQSLRNYSRSWRLQNVFYLSWN